MEVRIIYSKEQLEAAVDFISIHNAYFRGKNDYIRDCIIKTMRRIAKNPEEWINGTMGFVLWGDREFEGMNSDENTVHFEISVNPALDCAEDTYVEETIHG